MASIDPSAATNVKSNFKLVIKAANQKYEDFIVDNCHLDWSIKNLKDYLSVNYPKNPNSQSIRLIYSGKLLHDHFSLKDCIRHNSDVTSHIIHLVHSANSLKPSTERQSDENEIDLDNELTPESSINSDSVSTSSSTSSTSSLNASPTISSPSRPVNSFIQLQNDINNIFNQQPQQNETLTPKQQYDQTLTNLTNYYQSIGVPVQTNYWYSAYIQHMALYNHMYSNYLNSFNSTVGLNTGRFDIGNTNQFTENVNNQIRREESSIAAEEQAPPVQQPQAPEPNLPPVRNQVNNNDNNNDLNAGDREDDWLGILHNIVSFLVLFSIVYYYSSLERFLVIFTIVIVLIFYHNGWLSLQRRRINQPQVNRNQERRNNNQNDQEQRRQQEQVQNEGANENNNNSEQNLNDSSSNRNDQQQQLQQPNIFRLIVTFILTFFTSLIPERPRVLN